MIRKEIDQILSFENSRANKIFIGMFLLAAAVLCTSKVFAQTTTDVEGLTALFNWCKGAISYGMWLVGGGAVCNAGYQIAYAQNLKGGAASIAGAGIACVLGSLMHSGAIV